MRIVAADPGDAAAVDLTQALDAETLIRYPGEPVFGIEADGFIEQGGVFLLGHVDGSAVACGALRPLEGGVFEVKRMYVRDGYRRRGLSRRLYSRLELIARDRGCRTLRIETGGRQPEALGLYRSVGFAKIDRYGPYVENEYSICFAKYLPSAADLQFLRDFETCELPEAQWTHLSHVRIAWLYLTQLASADALQRLRDGILRFNAEVLGRRQEYHETVTVAFSRIISDRIFPGEVWEGFSRRIDDLLDGRSPMLARYYSQELLSSATARQSFVEADLEELPAFADAGI